MSYDHKKYKISYTLESLELNPEQIKSGEYDSAEVYWLKYSEGEENGAKCGLFWMFDLKNYLQKNLHVGPDFQICSYGRDPEKEDNWKPIFEEPFFQRRQGHPRPQDVESQLSQLSDHHDFKENHQIYLLVHGQKIGPYAYEDIRQQLNEGAILVTDMISLDGGHNWGHLYEIAEFDRRRWDPQHLPHKPEKDPPYRTRKTPEDEEVNALTNLAHIGHSKGKKRDSHPEESADDSEPMTMKKVMTLGVFFFSVMALGFLMWPGEKQVKTATQQSSEKPIKKRDVTPESSRAEKSQNSKSESDRRQPSSEPPTDKKQDETEAKKKRKGNQLRVEDSRRNDKYYGTQKKPIKVEPSKIPETQKREFSNDDRNRNRDRRRPSSEPRAWGEAIGEDSPARDKRRRNDHDDRDQRDDYSDEDYDDPYYDERRGRGPDANDTSYEREGERFDDPYNEEFGPDGDAGPDGYRDREYSRDDYPQRDEYDHPDERDGRDW